MNQTEILKNELNKLRESLEEVSSIFSDPEAREALLTVYTESKDDLAPVFQIMRDTIGVDLDNFVDETIKWGTKKAFVAYIGYQSAGFTKKEAMQLTLNLKVDFNNALRSINNAKYRN